MLLLLSAGPGLSAGRHLNFQTLRLLRWYAYVTCISYAGLPWDAACICQSPSWLVRKQDIHSSCKLPSLNTHWQIMTLIGLIYSQVAPITSFENSDMVIDKDMPVYVFVCNIFNWSLNFFLLLFHRAKSNAFRFWKASMKLSYNLHSLNSFIVKN